MNIACKPKMPSSEEFCHRSTSKTLASKFWSYVSHFLFIPMRMSLMICTFSTM
jgi:hypothetical protein